MTQCNTIILDKDWFFSLADREENSEIITTHASWDRVTVPHDWSLPLGYDRNAPSGGRWGFVHGGIGWYRRVLFIGPLKKTDRVFIDFEGVFMNADVYINGIHLGCHRYGYTPFSYDLTPHLAEGANILAVRVDCEKLPASRWYSGCGIFRPVHLRLTGETRLVPDGITITVPVAEEDRAEIRVTAEAVLPGGTKGAVTHSIIKDGRVLATLGGGPEETLSAKIDKPDRWSPETPSLYICETKLIVGGKEADRIEMSFGIRKTEFIPHKGFYLNGQNLKFKGVCLHHDAGVTGGAVPDDYMEKRLRLLKEMGCNAVRTSHNPFTKGFYDLCDRLGLMVMDEIFDGWEKPKATYDYGHYFEENHEKDITDWIRRDRNHPSVVMWSLGNEVHDMDPELTVKLQDMVHRLDPTRPVTCGVQGTGDVSDRNRALLDIAGYNDGGGACFIYDEDHAKRPDQLFIATEAPHTYQTRDFYRTQTWWRDKNQPRQEIENLTEEEIFFDGHVKYHSGYDNAGVRTCVRDSWTLAEERPYLMGEFRWTGFDYHGESYGWPARWHEHGVIDMANYPKDPFYLYQAMWKDPEAEPMVHLLPHWTHPGLEGITIPVWVYTNAYEAELFLNGRSLGSKKKGRAKHLAWDVPYEPGEIKALARSDGRVVAEKSRRTAGVPTDLGMTVDTERESLTPVRTVQVDYVLQDTEGTLHPRGDSLIYTLAEGGQLLGMENGDVVDLTPVSRPWRRAFHGRAMALVRLPEDKSSPVRVHGAALLGESIFKETTQLTACTRSIEINGAKPPAHRFKISLNNGEWRPYDGPLTLTETTLVRARLFDGRRELITLAALFQKGERPPVIDRIHGNGQNRGEVTLRREN